MLNTVPPIGEYPSSHVEERSKINKYMGIGGTHVAILFGDRSNTCRNREHEAGHIFLPTSIICYQLLISSDLTHWFFHAFIRKPRCKSASSIQWSRVKYTQCIQGTIPRRTFSWGKKRASKVVYFPGHFQLLERPRDGTFTSARKKKRGCMSNIKFETKFNENFRN